MGRRLSTMTWSSVTTATTRGATPPTSPTTTPSRRRSARRTSERAVSSSTSRLPSTRLWRSAELLWSRIATSRDPRSAALSTSPSAGPSRRSMKSRMMLSTAKLRLRRSARRRHPDTLPPLIAKVAQGGLQRLQEACPKVHPHHRMYQGAQGALRPRRLWIHPGRGGLLSQAADYCPGRPQGDLLPRAPEDLQARDQAGAQALPRRGVCRCPQGGLHQAQNQPQTCQEARRQEVVLRA